MYVTHADNVFLRPTQSQKKYQSLTNSITVKSGNLWCPMLRNANISGFCRCSAVQYSISSRSSSHTLNHWSKMPWGLNNHCSCRDLSVAPADMKWWSSLPWQLGLVRTYPSDVSTRCMIICNLAFHPLWVAVLWKLLTFCPPTLNFHLSTTLHTDDTGHETSDTRLSRFSRVTSKSWEWPGDEANFPTLHNC